MKNGKPSLQTLEIESHVTALSVEEQTKQKGGTVAYSGSLEIIVGSQLEEFVSWLTENYDLEEILEETRVQNGWSEVLLAAIEASMEEFWDYVFY